MTLCAECGKPLVCEDMTNIVPSGKPTFTPEVCVNPQCPKSPLHKSPAEENASDEI
jgi:hypothetical protein